MIGAGELDKRISILVEQKVDNGLGVKSEYAPVATVWAKATPISDGERFRAGSYAYQLQMRFIIRKREVSNTSRIQYGSKIFAITAVKDIEGHFIEITAGSIKANG